MDVKERILVKAEELFLQYGIRSVSMDDIANSLGMSKKTLYQYYADKDELVDAVVDGHISGMQADCLTCRKDAKDAIHEIFIMMERIMDEFSNMNPMLLYDLEKFHFRAYRRFKDHKDKFLAQIIRQNIEWVERETIRRALENAGGVKKDAAELMGISQRALSYYLAKYRLD